MSESGDLGELRKTLRAFAAERHWQPFHTVKNLAMALGGEVGEVLAELQWLSDEEITNALDEGSLKESLGSELADTFIYLLLLSDTAGIDLLAATHEKVATNRERFPPPDGGQE